MFYYYYNYSPGVIIITIICLALGLLSQVIVNSAYSKYSKVANKNGYTGAQAARKILDKNGLYDIQIQKGQGKLTDHYNPKTKVIMLSPDVYEGNSVASVGVAAHETGHAIQHDENYHFLWVRNFIAPVVNFAPSIGTALAVMGIFLELDPLVPLGLLIFSFTAIFSLITLPVEINASNKALLIIEGQELMPRDQLGGVKSVLRAAALTYVVALVTSILHLISLILRLNNMKGRKR